MSYIGLVGPYSTGKTTATDEILMFDADSISAGSVVVVNCDNCRERWYSSGVEKELRNPAWQGKVADKHSELVHVAGLDDHLYICETAWTDHITGAAKVPDGVVDFIVLTVAPATMKLFIQERCEKRNKQFRADYWDEKRCTYEGTGRPLNAANRYLTPAGIRWQHYEMDYKRTVWNQILDRLWDDIISWEQSRCQI